MGLLFSTVYMMTYMTLSPRSITGVPLIPTSGLLLLHPSGIGTGAALPAEDQREEPSVGLAGLGALFRHFQMTFGLRLYGCPYCVAAREKLMEPEGKDWETARCAAPQLGTLEQETAEHLGTLRRIRQCQPREFFGCAVFPLHSPRGLPDKPAGFFLRAHTKGGLDP